MNNFKGSINDDYVGYYESMSNYIYIIGLVSNTWLKRTYQERFFFFFFLNLGYTYSRPRRINIQTQIVEAVYWKEICVSTK